MLLIKNKTLILSIFFSSNNIFYSVTNLLGNTLFWISSGYTKLKGTKKTTVNIIKYNLNLITFFLTKYNIQLHVKFKGLNRFKKIVLKQIKESKLHVLTINDETALPHNGCKSTKSRRI